MIIIYQPRFIDSFANILDYISIDSKNNAINFKKDIKERIENIPSMPFKCRKSIYFNDDNIRDLIFKGYTIVYKINEKDETLLIVGIKKYQQEL